MTQTDPNFEFENDDDFEFKDPIENPALAAAAAAMAEEDAPREDPVIVPPSDGPVTLPGGFRRVLPGGEEFKTEMVTSAWVAELTGEDEERIAKAQMKQDDGAFVDAILTGGVERLGDTAPTKADLDALLIGDREFLLLEISRATYGNEIHYDDFTCFNCGEKISFVVHKDTDIPITRLDKPEDSEFEVRLRNDRIATVSLPNGEDQRAVFQLGTGAEANTSLIVSCVSEIRGGRKGTERIAGNRDAALRLGVVDRQTLVNAMAERMPGPRYNEVKFTHDECGGEVSVEVTLADLFRGL